MPSSTLKDIFNSVKDDVKELTKIGIVTLFFSCIFYWVFKDWALTTLFFVIVYSMLLNSSYIVSIDKKLRSEGRL